MRSKGNPWLRPALSATLIVVLLFEMDHGVPESVGSPGLIGRMRTLTAMLSGLPEEAAADENLDSRIADVTSLDEAKGSAVKGEAEADKAGDEDDEEELEEEADVLGGAGVAGEGGVSIASGVAGVVSEAGACCPPASDARCAFFAGVELRAALGGTGVGKGVPDVDKRRPVLTPTRDTATGSRARLILAFRSETLFSSSTAP